MARIKNRFGTLIGWNNITVHILGRDVDGITEVDYEDEMEMNNEHGGGEFPVGQSEGNYEAKVSMTLYAEEIIALQKSLPSGKRLQQIKPFDIPVVYEYDGEILKDVIRNCRIKNNGRSVKQGDGKIVQKLELLCSHIDWNV